MTFFESEVVQSEMLEISKLQEEVYNNVFKFYSMTNREKLEHIETLKKLLQKQKVLYTRLSLSDDSKAQEIKSRIMDSALMMGLPKGMDMNIVFSNMEKVVESMKEYIDNQENS